MKLHILSDVHLEFGKWPAHHDINAIEADVTILAEDIGEGLEGIEWALTIDRPVIYVMGNHEFYGSFPMHDLWQKAREMVAETHVHLLENESLLLPDLAAPDQNVRFLGASLWTDFCAIGSERQDECMESAKRSMTDYSAITIARNGFAPMESGYSARQAGDRLTPRKILAMHHESRDFLEQELRRMPDPLGIGGAWEKTVVVTHHAPSALSLAGKKAVGHGSAAYASHLEYLVEDADVWVHGHTHVPADY